MRQKASPEGVRCESGRRAKAIPPVTCRDCLVMTPKSRPGCSLGMSLDGDLLAGQAASGIKVARAWLRLLYGTREPGASICANTRRRRGAERENSKRKKPQGEEYRSEAQGRGVP